MKRLTAMLLVLALLFLTGCDSLVKDSYQAVVRHSEEPPEPASLEAAEEQQVVVSNRTELRGAVLSYIRSWVEHDYILVRDYKGSLEADLEEILRYATQEDPIGAYAVDFLDGQLTGDRKEGKIELSIVFRRSSSEINSIVTVNNTDRALTRIDLALKNFEPSLTLRIRNYKKADFEEYLRSFCALNPNLMPVIPQLSAELYPTEGQTRILEMHFLYPENRDELRQKQKAVSTILDSAASYVNTGKGDRKRIEMLGKFLSNRFVYKIGPEDSDTPVYSLLCDGIASSLAFSTVFRYECNLAELPCWLVEGTLNGSARYWNIVLLDDVYYHLDLMAGVEQGQRNVRFFTQGEMAEAGYQWDRENYPANPEPVTEETLDPSAEEGMTDGTGMEPTEEPTEEPSETQTEPDASQTEEPGETSEN